MKTYKLRFCDEDYTIGLAKDKYVNNGTLAVLMFCTTPTGEIIEDFGDLTVNIDDSDVMANETNSQFIDVNNLGEDIMKWLVDNDIAKPTGFIGYSGYCVYPLFQFTQQALDEMDTLK